MAAIPGNHNCFYFITCRGASAIVLAFLAQLCVAAIAMAKIYSKFDLTG
jgi:hypothetical protein